MSYDKVLSIPALGRSFHLGMLYDCRSDNPISGKTLWNPDILDKKSVHTLENAEYEVITSDSLENKTHALELNADLRLSFYGGLVDISGSGKYLDYRKRSSCYESITLKYKCKTKSEEMNMEQLGKGKMQHLEVFDHDTATHVVTEITYGGNAFFVFDRKVTSESDRLEAHGRLQALVKKIPKICISGSGDLKLSDEEKKEVEKFHCRYYGDFIPPENPSTFKDAVSLYKMLPTLLGENKQKVVPIKVQLYPLSLLDSKGCRLVRDISIMLVKETEDIFEGLYALELRCNGVLESETVRKLWKMQGDIKRFVSCLKTYRLQFQREIFSLLPAIRGGGKEEDELSNILEKDKMSPISQEKLTLYIEGLEQKVTNLSQFTANFSEVTFSESFRYDLARPTVLCFSILIPGTRVYLNKMEKYLRKQTSNTDSSLDVGNDGKISAKKSSDGLPMMRKARDFLDFYDANSKSGNTAFIVSHEHSDSHELGAEINYFKYGELIQRDFDIPTAPGKPVSDDTGNTESSILVKWDPPSSGASNIIKYKVHYSKIHEDNATCELDAGLSNNGCRIDNLKPACEYIVWIQGVCAVGATICSDKSDPIKTKPVIQEGKPAKYELHRKSKVIERSKALIIYQPHLVVIHEDKSKMLKKLQLGSASQTREEKVVMLLGEIGSGKTTLINGLINYIAGVQWKDPFRFKLITEPQRGNQAQSHSTQICAYTICHQEGFRIPYNLTIIDTPGFGNVSGIQRDEDIINQISDLFSTEGSYGINHLDAICLVVSSSNSRLSQMQQYLFNKVLSIYYKDITDNMFLFFTFCDGHTPQALSSVTKANFPYQDYFKFNNSDLYSYEESDRHEQEKRSNFSSLGAMLWKMGEKSFKAFFEVL